MSVLRALCRSATEIRMRSPVLTKARGPPDAASGVTCSTMVPYAAPDMRASEMRTMRLGARPSPNDAPPRLLQDRPIKGGCQNGRLAAPTQRFLSPPLDGSRAEFKISDRLLTSSSLLSNQSFVKKTIAAIMSIKPWYSRFVSPITLELPGQSPHEGEGTLEYFELK